MRLISPPKLRKDQAVGIICTSSGLPVAARHRLDQARMRFEQMGYEVCLGQYLFAEGGQVVGTVAQRVSDLHAMFANDRVGLVMLGIGGNHTNDLLPFIDYDLIRRNPKLVVGYSDATVLHYALHSQAGLQSFYGPCAFTQFGEYPGILEFTLRWFERACMLGTFPAAVTPAPDWTDEFLDWTQGHDRSRPRERARNPGYRWLRRGTARGGALPACVPSMNHLAGTKYWIRPEGKILMLDILALGSSQEGLIESHLVDLRNMGVFSEIAGLTVGRPFGYSDAGRERLFAHIEELAVGNYPIVLGMDLGHTDPMLTIRYGQTVELDGDRDAITLVDEKVCV
jgi:muramoyltetrapeptide carboxypeptidase